MSKNKFQDIIKLIGQNTKIKENIQSLKKNDEDFFMELLEQLCQIEAMFTIFGTMGLIINWGNNQFYNSIKMLMNLHFGERITEIILWWVFESLDGDGEIHPLIDEKGKEHIISTPTQLYKFIKKYHGK